MNWSKIYNGLQAATIYDLHENITFKAVLANTNRIRGKKNIDFTCPICVTEALRDFKRLSEPEFLNLITPESMPERKLILKGTRQFNWRGIWNNDNLTDDHAVLWILTRPEVTLRNFEYSEEAFTLLKQKGIPSEALTEWRAKAGKSPAKAPEPPIQPLEPKEESETLKVTYKADEARQKSGKRAYKTK